MLCRWIRGRAWQEQNTMDVTEGQRQGPPVESCISSDHLRDLEGLGLEDVDFCFSAAFNCFNWAFSF